MNKREIWLLENKDKVKLYAKRTYEKHKNDPNKKLNRKIYAINNRKNKNLIARNYYKRHQKELIIKMKEYYLKNKIKIMERHKKYFQEHKEHYNKLQRIYRLNKYKNDANFKIAKLYRERIRKLVKNKNKSISSLQLLDCSLDFLKLHLQRTAIDNGYKDFDINNYNSQEYNIDHIRPCSSFDLTDPEQQKQCFNWSNLQILSYIDNMHKFNHI